MSSDKPKERKQNPPQTVAAVDLSEGERSILEKRLNQELQKEYPDRSGVYDCIVQLKAVIITDAAWTNRAAKILASILPNCVGFHTFSLIRCKISKKGLKMLRDGLLKCPDLHTLQLVYITSDNVLINSMEIARWAPVFKQCKKLHGINFSNNQIEDAGVIELMQALPNDSPLHNLYLIHNGIGDKGFIALLQASLGLNRYLVLNLKANLLGDQSLKELARRLHEITWKELDVRFVLSLRGINPYYGLKFNKNDRSDNCRIKFLDMQLN